MAKNPITGASMVTPQQQVAQEIWQAVNSPEARRWRSNARQMARDSRSDRAQLAIISNRPGKSKREVARLTARIEAADAEETVAQAKITVEAPITEEAKSESTPTHTETAPTKEKKSKSKASTKRGKK